MKLLIIFVVLISLQNFDSRRFSCKNPQNEDVEWYVIYMFNNETAPDLNLTWAYYDSNSNGEFTFIEYNLTNFPPLNMIDKLDFKDETYNYFAWNDEAAGEKNYSFSYAHSKGLLVYDYDSGFVIFNSLPKFPYVKYDKSGFSNQIPYNVGYYTQHFLCVSTFKEETIKVVSQLNIIYPKYLAAVSKDNVDTPPNPEIVKAIEHKFDPELPEFDQVDVYSVNATKFTIFTKKRTNPQIPWDHIIPNNYEDSFYVETWVHPERMKPVCDNVFQVLNVDILKYGKYLYVSNEEHAKWGVSLNLDIMCFGDLNRVESQRVRGGMITCFEEPVLSQLFRDGILSSEGCN